MCVLHSHFVSEELPALTMGDLWEYGTFMHVHKLSNAAIVELTIDFVC